MKTGSKLRSLISWILSLTMLIGTFGGDRIPVHAGDEVSASASEAADVNAGEFSCDVSRVAVSIDQVNAQKVYQSLLVLTDYPGVAGVGRVDEGFYVDVNPSIIAPDIVGIGPDAEPVKYDIIVCFYGDGGIYADEAANIRYAKISISPDNDITQSEYTLNVSNLEEGMDFTPLHFTFYNVIVWDINASGATGNVGFMKDGALVNKIDDTFVKYGAKLNTAISAFPDARYNGKTISYWKELNGAKPDSDLRTITLDTTITEDLCVGPVWEDAPVPPPSHYHSYHGSTSENIAGQVEWTWTGTDEEGYTATVSICCTDPNCPDTAKGVQTLNATISENGASCTVSMCKCWNAEATFLNAVYTNVKYAAAETPACGHIWVVDTTSANVVWEGNDNDGYTRATIYKECRSLSHNEADDGPKKVAISVNTTVSDNGAKCGEPGIVYYTATFDSYVDPAITEELKFQKVVEGVVSGHDYKAEFVWTAGADYNTAPTASANLICQKDPTHRVDGLTATVTALSIGDAAVSKNYIATVTYADEYTKEEKNYTSDLYTVYDHTDHEWEVKFDWRQVSTNKADTSVTAEATCKNGGEKKALDVTLDDKTVGSKIEYLAKATDPNGKVWTSKKNIDTKSGESKDGPAGTPTVEGGDIVIIGLEETYPYTGSKIKPAVTVMDGDIVLAESTDYTVSYTGKNKIGEINKVEVKGKGNYAGKSATAQFKIVDPRDEVDKDKLADKVSKVSVNTKKFTYNGKAQYPSEVTVTLKDKSTIVYKVEEDGSFTTESEKEVGLSFSNNINKGTATVAAIGSDGKVKKASYTIAAAEIGSAEFEISAVDWAVKAATPEIKATIKLGDEDVELVAGQDYKVSFKTKEAGENKGTAKISGKGNFKGKHADVTYTVTPMEITENNIVVKALSGKKAKDVKVIVNDAFGNALNKKFYTVEIQNAEGTALNKGDALTEEIKVVVKGANAAVTTGEDGVTVDVKPAADIAKVKGAFKVDKNFFKTYTGEPITLDADDFVSGKINVGTLELGKDFNIVAYKNNIKKGTMTVTVQGDGEYSGTKTFKVKIKAKPIDKLAPEN